MQLIECVPNFSEGRDRQAIDRIAAAAAEAQDALVLHTDMGVDANRTVMTLVGTPAGVAEAAFRAVQAASKIIDMTAHTGAHPRIGASDVCPLIPLSGTSLETCIELAVSLGERIGERLGIPVYLYGRAAQRPDRIQLREVREGEYEALPDRLKSKNGRPDFGPSRFNPRSGATAVGARELLIAFNVNLSTADPGIARDIARDLRAGHSAPGGGSLPLMPAFRTMGWTMPTYGCAQVSMNLINFRMLPPHAALEAVRIQATARGITVTGSELVGMTPLAAILSAGEFYRSQAGMVETAEEDELIQAAISGLGLASVRPFKPEEQILEIALRRAGEPWAAAAQGIRV